MTENQKWKKKWKNKVLIVVSNGNQDGISKSNTAPQLAGIIITNRNSREHKQIKVNQKEMPHLKKYFSFFI